MLIRTLIAATLALSLGAEAVAQQEPSLQDRVDALAQQIYRRYQHYPPALAARRGAAEQVLAAWNEVAPDGEEKTSAENVARMTDWLDAALRAVMPGGEGELPAAPAFEQPQLEEPQIEAPVVVTEELPADEPVPTPRREAAEPNDNAMPANKAEPNMTSVVEPERSRLKVSDPVVTIHNPYVNDVAPKPQRTEPSVNPLRRSPRQADPFTESEPTKSQFAGPRATAKPVVPAPDLPVPQRSKWSQHPSAAPLEWRDPFADDPAASPNPLRSGSRHESQRPEYRLSRSTPSRSTPSRSTRVNLRQLSADIRGYNAALRSLQSAVMGLKETDIAALAAAEEELDRLDERRQFLDLYREGLTSDEESVLPKSPSAEVVRELVRRKTETLSDRASSSPRDERRAQQNDWFDSF